MLNLLRSIALAGKDKEFNVTHVTSPSVTVLLFPVRQKQLVFLRGLRMIQANVAADNTEVRMTERETPLFLVHTKNHSCHQNRLPSSKLKLNFFLRIGVILDQDRQRLNKIFNLIVQVLFTSWLK